MKYSMWPSFSLKESKEISKTLLSNKVNYWTGNKCTVFESEFSKVCKVKYSIALSNGTVALDLALKALEVEKGDEIIVTPRSYIASVSSVVNAGAVPIFADVDLNSGNINAESIKKVISKKTKGIICVHLGGFPCEMDEIVKLSRKQNIFIIEDCSQAHGAIYKGKPVGSIGDIGTWSFCQDKIITTAGEGGMVTTNNQILFKKMRSYKDHGKNFKKVMESKKSNSIGFKYVHDNFGTNFRMTEIQAAIGIIQSKELQKWNKIRKRNSEMIYKVIKKYDDILRIQEVPSYVTHGWYRCYSYVNSNNKKILRKDLIKKIINSGIPCSVGSCPEIYKEDSIKKIAKNPHQVLPNAKILGDESVAFLVHPSIDFRQMKDICLKLDAILKSVR